MAVKIMLNRSWSGNIAISQAVDIINGIKLQHY